MSDKPLKVLSVCASDTKGGAARAAYRIHQGVKELGVDCRLFVKEKRSKDGDVILLDEFVPENPLYKAFDWVRNNWMNKLQQSCWNRYPDRENYLCPISFSYRWR